MSLFDKITYSGLEGARLPEPIKVLEELAADLSWRRSQETMALFERLDPEMWARGASPAQIVLESDRLENAAADPKAVQEINDAHHWLLDYRKRAADGADPSWPTIGYFCAEYGVDARFPMYCGGLGILAGDHCAEASDMGLPFVAIGLFYRRSFFRQMLGRDGRQEHYDPVILPEAIGLRRVLVAGKPLTLSLSLPGRTISIAVWVARVGNVPLLLMDSDLPGNKPEDRVITSQLYTVGREMRLCQEVILGVGGVRVLEALGIQPDIYHLNEGHSALLLLERLRALTAAGVAEKDAKKQIKASSVLTIHTPIPDGNERFDARMVGSFLEALGGLNVRDVLKLGLDSHADTAVFDMTASALRQTKAANGVSLLHGKTADKTWRKVAGRKVIGVTNGVHMPTWIGPEMSDLFQTEGVCLDPVLMCFTTRGRNGRGRWADAESIDDEALWEAHLAQKRRLVAFARERLFQQHARYGEDPSQLRQLFEQFDPDALLVGFARRFAPYKRGALVFTDERRLAKIVNSKDRPVQIVFSGKAYPTDRAGQAVLQKIYQKSQSPRFKGRIFVIEDYNIEIARMLVQGADVWLNNPRRPLEASGTSGMKAAANGAPNASILDGWWDEAYHAGAHPNGFAIGESAHGDNEKLQDKLDAEALYGLLENSIIPSYYSAPNGGLPKPWIKLMKSSIADSLEAFSTRRMIEDYIEMYDSAG